MWPSTFHTSIASLALRMVTVYSTIALLQMMSILPETKECPVCFAKLGPYKNSVNYNYFECKPCKRRVSLLHGTVLYNSNTKLREFVLLMYQFCENHRSYITVTRETCLPVEGYQNSKISSQTINKWFAYFRHLCVEDAKKNQMKIGAIGFIVEIDETMCGKLKFGLGDGTDRRRAWIFGGICRETGRCFMRLCPKNKRTKKALWPILQAHLEPGTTIYSDGWRAYRKLPTIGFKHRWVNHSRKGGCPYVDPDDRTLHTNGIEGMWGKFKRWLPQGGRYNLEQYMWLYQWVEEKKVNGTDPFWALVELVAADNNVETLEMLKNTAENADDTEAMPYNEEGEAEMQREADDKDSDAEDSDAEDSDEEDHEIFYFYDCVFCKEIFCQKEDLLTHINLCTSK